MASFMRENLRYGLSTIRNGRPLSVSYLLLLVHSSMRQKITSYLDFLYLAHIDFDPALWKTLLATNHIFSGSEGKQYQR